MGWEVGESLNISERNIGGKLGRKSLNWAQMPCDTGLRVFSYTPSSVPVLYTVKSRICYHIHFHPIRGKMRIKRLSSALDEGADAEL